jgi:hypothetical protein
MVGGVGWVGGGGGGHDSREEIVSEVHELRNTMNIMNVYRQKERKKRKNVSNKITWLAIRPLLLLMRALGQGSYRYVGCALLGCLWFLYAENSFFAF